jgi:hypothetical protein
MISWAGYGTLTTKVKLDILDFIQLKNIPSTQKLHKKCKNEEMGMVTYICNPSTWESESRGYNFGASWGNTVRYCLKKIKYHATDWEQIFSILI